MFSSDLKTQSTPVKHRRRDVTQILRGYEYDCIDVEEDGRLKKVFICKYDNCHKKFSKTWNFLDHAKAHVGLKPFRCEYCSKTFTQKGNMQKHMRKHLIEDIEERRAYKCPYCPKAYTDKYNLSVSSTSLPALVSTSIFKYLYSH